MFGRLYSFKFIISVALLWLGALAYGLALYSTQVYRGHAIENQLESLQSMLELESNEAIEDLYARQKRFAFKLQGEARFVDALKQRDAVEMEAWLAESYGRYPVASGQFKLRTIVTQNPLANL